jgi:hypothetical protein
MTIQNTDLKIRSPIVKTSAQCDNSLKVRPLQSIGESQKCGAQQRRHSISWIQLIKLKIIAKKPEPVFLNVYGAQESIPKKEFRQPM